MQIKKPHPTRHFLAVLAIFAVTFSSPTQAQVINEDFKIFANDAEPGDKFGSSVAVNNGLVVVGAPVSTDNGFQSGSAYLFDVATGTQLFKLVPNDGMPEDHFGVSVAIQNDIMAIGAMHHLGNGSGSGSVFIYNTKTGALITTLIPDDGAPDDAFGFAVDIDNGIVAVGSLLDDDSGFNSGSAYLFDAFTGAQIRKIVPSDGTDGDQFGSAIAVDNGIVAVGARFDNEAHSNAGSAYLFDATTGIQIAKIFAEPNPGTPVRFGSAIAMDDGIVAVSTTNDGDQGFNTGSVYLFDASDGALRTKILPFDGMQGDFFGKSVSLDNGILAVGSRSDDHALITNVGSAYLFQARSGSFISKVVPTDSVTELNLGLAVSFHSGYLAAGAINDSTQGLSAGSAYIVDFNCQADFNGDLALDFFDISLFLTAFNAGDQVADLTGDGAFDFFDISEFLTIFNAGCP